MLNKYFLSANEATGGSRWTRTAFIPRPKVSAAHHGRLRRVVRHDGTPVDYAVGDISSLDAPDGHYDGVRCERVLQHLPEPDAAIRELIRVTRPGGRVCVIDTDWPSCAWDGFDP
ncbi:methyltransferase domain-containing protein [Streptomyces werraensis]|uniref:methyltransferase domain-containing protein n=1 Tax=Streptomyces werraensis TaxID=68284 RepID=UPI0037CF0D45